MESTKITPSEILALMNEEIREINIENGNNEDASLVRYVTMDSEGVYCWDTLPCFDYSIGVMKFKPHYLHEGLEFNSNGYEIVGLNMNQMFVDYSI